MRPLAQHAFGNQVVTVVPAIGNQAGRHRHSLRTHMHLPLTLRPVWLALWCLASFRPHEYVMQLFQAAGNRPLRSVVVPPDGMIREALMKAMLVRPLSIHTHALGSV